jgi:molecular chaperone GrpE
VSGPQGPTERDPDQTDPAEQDSRGPTIRDRRRIDPETGAVRSAPDAPQAPAGPEPAAPTTGAGSGSDTDRVTLLEMELAERTQDLQRVQAEYVNYRRRMDRDRIAARDVTVAGVVADLMPVLDDIGRAEEHGELVGGFKSVADALDAVLTRYGVQRFGEAGDPFDPAQHEALMHTYSDEVTETTCQQVFQPGYRLGDRVIRPARVAVADPTEALPPVDEATADEPGSAPPPAG